MSTHNICFHGEIRKILCGYPLLTVAMRFLHKHAAVLLELLRIHDWTYVHCRHLKNNFKGLLQHT